MTRALAGTAYPTMAKRQRTFPHKQHRTRLAPYKRAENKTRFRSKDLVLTRCEVSGMKVAHATYDDALEAALRSHETRGVLLRIYPCRGHFHLTSQI